MRHLKDSTLWKYAKGDNLEKSIAAHAELDRRFYIKHPDAFIHDLKIRDEQFFSQEQSKCLSDVDFGEVEHDPR